MNFDEFLQKSPAEILGVKNFSKLPSLVKTVRYKKADFFCSDEHWMQEIPMHAPNVSYLYFF